MSQRVAPDALRGSPQLQEVDADLAHALPSTALPPDEHLFTGGKAFYVAEEPLTASDEVLAHGVEPSVTARFSFYRSSATMLDLTNPQVAKMFGYDATKAYSSTQQVAERASQMGYDAIKYKSVRGAGDNYAILKLEKGSMQPQMVAPSP